MRKGCSTLNLSIYLQNKPIKLNHDHIGNNIKKFWLPQLCLCTGMVFKKGYAVLLFPCPPPTSCLLPTSLVEFSKLESSVHGIDNKNVQPLSYAGSGEIRGPARPAQQD